MNAIDHKAEALACEAAGLSIMRTHDMAPHMEAVMQFDLARLHAQLALVEQQRIANLIAMFHLDEADTRDFTTRGVIFPQVSAEIAKGLGL